MRALPATLVGVIAAGLVCGGGMRVGASARADAPDAKRYDEQVRPFLARHCLGCHAGEEPKGDLRLDQLRPDFVAAASRDQWLTVLKRVEAGEMPPPKKPRPPAA